MATLKTAFCCICFFLAVLSVQLSEANLKDTKTTTNSNRRSQIPAHVWKELAKINSTVDFIMKFVRRPHPEQESDNTTELSKNITSIIFPEAAAASPDANGAEIVADMLPVPDEGCQPRMAGVRLPKAESADIIYWPKCLPLRRCGGCCGDDILECVPSAVSTVQIMAMKTRYIPEEGSFDFEGMEAIDLEDHVSCQCRCRVTESHCNELIHVHDQHNCRCVCKENKALTCTSNQKWDERSCKCVCRDERECHDGEYFNPKACSCFKIPSQHNEVNPCASTKCKAGYKGLPNADGTCQCLVSSNDWGDSAPANSPDGHGQEIVEVPDETTTTPTTTVRPYRPRPSRRRAIPSGRRRPRREINKEDYIEE